MGSNEVSSILITGANAGIGRELARQLGARAETSHVYLGCRDRQRGLAAIDGLKARHRSGSRDRVAAHIRDSARGRRRM